MGIYDRYILPRLVDFACGLKPMTKQREKIVPLASGRVLELGIGSGLNLPFYDPAKVTHLWGLDPSREMWSLAEAAAEGGPVRPEFIEASAEDIPLDDGSADTVLVTYTLCTIPAAAKALREARRVLRPGGHLLFCEHGRAPDESVRRWQDRIDPVWTRLAGGCHLNRAIPELIESSGFAIAGMETMYLPGWRPASFNFWGQAEPARRRAGGG